MLAVVAMAAVGSASALAQQSVRDGIEAWQREDYAGAIAIWRPLAQKGDADAAFNLGQAYRLGRGVAVDLAAAQGWLERAARAGHLDAQTTLGLLLFDSGNRQAAMRWLKEAAEHGEPRAMLVYGTALFNGDGVPRDPVVAYAYVSRAAAQGLEPARTTLADMDQLLPVDVRQKGVALAMSKAKAKASPTAKPPVMPKSAKKAPAKPSTPAVPANSGSWRIQLGAFSKRSSAEELYTRLSGKAPVSGHQPVYEKAGSVTRLQLTGFASRSEASAACAKLDAMGQACFPVEGK
ncbi:MAG TPA: SPOR domain-containing protein [Sphingomicrobium sp.]|nr:SPOR domain-containing protein [Sphingomicrobium sp.]